MNSVFGWMIITRRGKPVVTDCKLPIYALRKIAIEEMKNLYLDGKGHSVVKVMIDKTSPPTKPSRKKISALNISPGWPVRKNKSYEATVKRTRGDKGIFIPDMP